MDNLGTNAALGTRADRHNVHHAVYEDKITDVSKCHHMDPSEWSDADDGDALIEHLKFT